MQLDVSSNNHLLRWGMCEDNYKNKHTISYAHFPDHESLFSALKTNTLEMFETVRPLSWETDKRQSSVKNKMMSSQKILIPWGSASDLHEKNTTFPTQSFSIASA